LDRQPALELIEGTLSMWCRIITKGRLFEEIRDTPRFQDAFLTLGARKTWPVPSDFLESLPPIREAVVKPLLIDDEAVRARRIQSFDELAKKLGISRKEPADDDQ
jgi:hypothetical protein